MGWKKYEEEFYATHKLIASMIEEYGVINSEKNWHTNNKD